MEINSYITGFADGEGCFSVSFSKRNKMKLGIEVRPSFSVSQHKRSKEIIFEFQKFFRCGGIRYSKCDQNFKYEVRSIGDLIKKVIPHFEKYQLKTSKKEDFENFKKICFLIHSNHHLSEIGMKEIIELSNCINKNGKKKYEREYLLKFIAR